MIGNKFMRKIIDKLVDWMLKILINYKTNRKLSEIKKRDPFIYN